MQPREKDELAAWPAGEGEESLESFRRVESGLEGRVWLSSLLLAAYTTGDSETFFGNQVEREGKDFRVELRPACCVQTRRARHTVVAWVCIINQPDEMMGRLTLGLDSWKRIGFDQVPWPRRACCLPRSAHPASCASTYLRATIWCVRRSRAEPSYDWAEEAGRSRLARQMARSQGDERFPHSPPVNPCLAASSFASLVRAMQRPMGLGLEMRTTAPCLPSSAISAPKVRNTIVPASPASVWKGKSQDREVSDREHSYRAICSRSIRSPGSRIQDTPYYPTGMEVIHDSMDHDQTITTPSRAYSTPQTGLVGDSVKCTAQ
nr:hypothetical protein CFP56_78478 [Quercus suber]